MLSIAEFLRFMAAPYSPPTGVHTGVSRKWQLTLEQLFGSTEEDCPTVPLKVGVVAPNW